MTIPNERLNAIINAKEFLRALLDPKATPKVPKAIRRQAYYALRHYPSIYDLEGMLSKEYQELLDKIKA